MNTSPPKIFNPRARDLAQARSAKRQARSGISFLYSRAAKDAASRLEDINRQFGRSVLVGAMDGRDIITAELRSDRRPENFLHVVSPADINGQYDLIVSLLELQSDDTIPDTLMQYRKHLAPDGLLLVAFFGGETLTELRQSLYATDQAVIDGAAARVYPMVDYSQAAMLLGRTGLALPVVDMDRVKVSYGKLMSLVSDLRDLGLTNVLTARDKRPLTRKWLAALKTNYAEHFARADGKLTTTFEIIWMTGWAPHKNQQKPLKPGSAKMRLADALKTQETKI
ncbi:MAG: SAM-dependent methyltransferase [Litorimonas sp.]